MKDMIRSLLVLAAGVCLAGALGFAQSSGEAVYKGHCASCHGTDGVPPGMIGQIMGVKPINDPAMKKLTEAQMVTSAENGKGKMPAFKGKLTDAQIKAAVDYFRTFMKK